MLNEYGSPLCNFKVNTTSPPSLLEKTIQICKRRNVDPRIGDIWIPNVVISLEHHVRFFIPKIDVWCKGEGGKDGAFMLWTQIVELEDEKRCKSLKDNGHGILEVQIMSIFPLSFWMHQF